ncbi:protein DA1 [Actinokineospora diospyrosa]|uniref:Protein DA1-like domain-containing protein n=1 Tax=Actinokineospora diospyrosa TaxID=103728 RepID=A0ABT1I7V8_9PSEU|nr:protein DA1 [Actinokineospora diospyrosa]MCP2268707.1 Protein of unknown function (DUF3633) [Actinokineospora diospyrosa]
MTLACTVCGGEPLGTYELSMHEEATCASHPVAARCTLCGRPAPDPRAPGWSRWGAAARCPRCALGAIETQEDARGQIPEVRAAMAALGIELTRRVRVTLAGHGPLSVETTGRDGVLGITHQQWGPAGYAAVSIEIAAGLTPIHFGATLAHELGHAWLAERKSGPLPLPLEEGVCEVFAGAWLKKQGTPMATRLRASMEANRDPIYGDGYRMVRAAILHTGIESVLTSVIKTGALPRPGG